MSVVDGRVGVHGLESGTSSAGQLMGLAANGRPTAGLDLMRIVPGGDEIDRPREGLVAPTAVARLLLLEAGCDRLGLAGGVAFNCSANRRLWRDSGSRDLFVHPVAGRAGRALGAAVEAVRRRLGLAWPASAMRSVALGPSFDGGQVVGWFQEPAETGLRAFGKRSILADPRRAATRDHLNASVKLREGWRPLAPSIASQPASQPASQRANQPTNHARVWWRASHRLAP